MPLPLYISSRNLYRAYEVYCLSRYERQTKKRLHRRGSSYCIPSRRKPYTDSPIHPEVVVLFFFVSFSKLRAPCEGRVCREVSMSCSVFTCRRKEDEEQSLELVITILYLITNTADNSAGNNVSMSNYKRIYKKSQKYHSEQRKTLWESQSLFLLVVGFIAEFSIN